MELAQSVQESFLPTSTPHHENFVFAAGTHAAQVVGGDYYDFIPFGNDVLEMFPVKKFPLLCKWLG